MSAETKIVVPTGAIDGVNTTFTVPEPYTAGTAGVFLNGLLQKRDLEDGYTEQALVGAIEMNEPPRVGDVVLIMYTITTPDPSLTSETHLHGYLSDASILVSTLVIDDDVIAVLDGDITFTGRLDSDETISGVIADDEELLIGQIGVC